MEKGRIFSIEEFSVYDGPGIRTTVFFKGCPLRCSWCHSPEGLSNDIEIVRSPNGCLDCRKCYAVCPTNRENCILCLSCLKVCPQNLIRLSGRDYELAELVNILLKNKDILNNNNGGITISGGEPLNQSEFVLELARSLRGKVHVALQTSGFGSAEQFAKIIKEVDLVLFDMKIISPQLALKYEGINNHVILDNLAILKNSHTPFIVRIPLIPGVVDTKENIMSIIGLINKTSNLLRVELLPYNALAGSKYKMVSRSYQPGFDVTVSSNPRLDLFKENGIEAVLI